MSELLLVVDIDRTLARVPSDRSSAAHYPHLGRIEGMREMLSVFDSSQLIYLTSRPEEHEHVTVAWLKEHGFPGGTVWFRGEADSRPAPEMKEAVIREITAGRYWMKVIVIDDLEAMKAVCARNGWTFLQAHN